MIERTGITDFSDFRIKEELEPDVKGIDPISALSTETVSEILKYRYKGNLPVIGEEDKEEKSPLFLDEEPKKTADDFEDDLSLTEITISAPKFKSDDQLIKSTLKELKAQPTNFNINIVKFLSYYGEPLVSYTFNNIRKSLLNLKDRDVNTIESAVILYLMDIPINQKNIKSLKQFLFGDSLYILLQKLRLNIKQLNNIIF